MNYNAIFEINNEINIPLLHLEDLQELNKDYLNIVFVQKRKKRENDLEVFKELYRTIKKDGSVFLKLEGNINKEEFENIKKSGFKIFQLIGLKKYKSINNNHMINETDDMFWLTKDKPGKRYKKQLEKYFQKELWLINSETEYEYLKTITSNLLLLNFEDSKIENKEDMIMVNI